MSVRMAHHNTITFATVLGDWAVHPQRACRDVDPELFFPHSGDPTAAVPAKVICLSCPVRRECREYAVATPDLQGVWGATTAKDRRQIRRLGGLTRSEAGSG